MKRLLIGLIGLSMTSMCMADPATVNRSSMTQSNDSALISGAQYLDKVIVGSAVVNGVLGLYSSSFSAVPATFISSISLSIATTWNFENLKVNGLYYITTGNGAPGVTIIYKK